MLSASSILASAAAEFDLRLPDLSAVPKSRIGVTLVRHFLDRWEGDETLMALLRAGVTNAAAAERMRQIFAGQLGPAVAQWTGGAPDAPVRAGLAASQILGFALCRYVLSFPPVAAMSADEIVSWLAPTIQRYITGPRPATPPGRG